MALTTINLDVECDPDWVAETRLNAYSDFGCGVVDYGQPLLGRGLRAFPEASAVAGLGDGLLGEVILGGTRPRAAREAGLGAGLLGELVLGTGPELVGITVEVPPAYSTHKFAVIAFDDAGVEQGAALVSDVFVSSTDPETPRAFALLGYDAALDRFSFAVG